MGQIVCVDTHILIWGIQKNAKSSQEPMIERTSRFLRWLDDQKTIILLPSLVLAEFLMRIPTEQHAEIIGFLDNSFKVVPADALVASEYARIWQVNYNNGLPTNVPREKMKIDHLIVATAVARKAEIIYSEDGNLHKFAQGFIEVKGVPIIPKQLEINTD